MSLLCLVPAALGSIQTIACLRLNSESTLADAQIRLDGSEGQIEAKGK